MTTSIQLSQNNFLGAATGFRWRRSAATTAAVFVLLVNPYFTDEGMSLGYNLWWREFDYSSFNTAQYSTTSAAAQGVLGLPITENDTVSLLFGIDTNEILTFPGSTPASIIDYINAVGARTFHAWRTELGWARDTRNDYFMPTRGTYQRVSAEVTLPGSTVEYFKLNYEFSKYWPLSPSLVLNTRAEVGYGDSYGDDTTRRFCSVQPTDPAIKAAAAPCAPGSIETGTVTATGLPFFENFYAGGVRSVRGFRATRWVLARRSSPASRDSHWVVR